MKNIGMQINSLSLNLNTPNSQFYPPMTNHSHTNPSKVTDSKNSYKKVTSKSKYLPVSLDQGCQNREPSKKFLRLAISLIKLDIKKSLQFALSPKISRKQ